jgi:hypothetical protein
MKNANGSASEHTSSAVMDKRDVAESGEAELLELLTEWIQDHHRSGGEFSAAAIAAAGEAGRETIRSGYSLNEAFQAGRTAYFTMLERLENTPVPRIAGLVS